jgi:hypothetical protein
LEQVRRRWLFSLVAFAAAAVFSTVMTFTGELLTGGIGQGLGLALLGSLPLFALGSLLGAMARAGGEARLPTASVGVPAVTGLALGFLLAGGVLLPNMAPYTLYLVCLTALSGAALLQGRILESPPAGRILGRAWTARGEVRVEERSVEGADGPHRLLLEGDRVRGAEGSDGEPAREWDRAVLQSLRNHPPRGEGAILHLGGGSGTMPRVLSREFPGVRSVVVEGSDALVRMAREHFHPFPGWTEVRVLIGDPWLLLDQLEGSFSLVLFDSGLAPLSGRLPQVPEAVWRRLSLLIGPRGHLVVGGIGDGALPGPDLLDAYTGKVARSFSRVRFYGGRGAGFFLLSGPEAASWPESLRGFSPSRSWEG